MGIQPRAVEVEIRGRYDASNSKDLERIESFGYDVLDYAVAEQIRGI